MLKRFANLTKFCFAAEPVQTIVGLFSKIQDINHQLSAINLQVDMLARSSLLLLNAISSKL